MIRVVLLGFGNVNYHLYNTLSSVSKVSVIQVYSRNYNNKNLVSKSLSFTQTISELKEADLYIMGLPDDEIGLISEKIPFENRFVVHTSGGVNMTAISSKNRRGVFYPLQTFSINRKPDFKSIPICIEAEKETDLKLLHDLGNYLSETVVEIDSEKRSKLHVAAVFVNNFTNYMYQIGNEITKTNKLSFDLLKPLIFETANKIENLSPFEVQTGPAKRNDVKTIEKHLHLLKDSTYQQLYQEITDAIQRTHGKKL